MYNCEKCNCIFSTKQMLDYHIKNKVCLKKKKKKKKYKCLFCNKFYLNHTIFLDHLNAKHHKKEILSNKEDIIKENLYNNYLEYNKILKESNNKDISNNKLNNIIHKIFNNVNDNKYNDDIQYDNSSINNIFNKKEIIKYNIDNKFKCKNCNKVFSRKYTLKRHMNNSCQKNTNINIINNTINNTTNNVNIVNNITINNIGQENTDTITDKVLERCANLCYLGIIELFKLIHMDINENKNLYLTSIKNPYIYKYENNKWQIADSKEVIKKLTDDKRDMIEDFVSNNLPKFTQFKRNNISKMFNDYKVGNLDNKYEKKIRIMLVNNKDSLRKSYEECK